MMHSVDSMTEAYDEVRERLGEDGAGLETLSAGGLLHTAWQLEDIADQASRYAKQLAQTLRDMAHAKTRGKTQ